MYTLWTRKTKYFLIWQRWATANSKQQPTTANGNDATKKKRRNLNIRIFLGIYSLRRTEQNRLIIKFSSMLNWRSCFYSSSLASAVMFNDSIEHNKLIIVLVHWSAFLRNNENIESKRQSHHGKWIYWFFHSFIDVVWLFYFFFYNRALFIYILN